MGPGITNRDQTSVIYAGVAALRSRRLEDLYAIWRGVKAGRDFPVLRAMDPIALGPFLRDLTVVCVHDPDMPRFRLFGSGFRDFFGGDFSGRPVSDLPMGGQEALAGTYRHVALSGEPCFGSHQWRAATGGMFKSEFMVLPYGDDGKVERLLIMEDLDDARRQRLSSMHRPTA